MAKRGQGLQCKRTSQPVPLQSIHNDVTICDTVASVKSTLLYHNETNVAIEAEFVFPMDDDSAVFQFEVEIDGKHIIGECQEKDQAKESYQEAVRQGHSAFMLGEDDTAGDIFCMNVGCLPPLKSATITFAYVVKLSFDDEGAVQFVLPTVLNPRYTPMQEGAPLQSTVTPAHRGAINIQCDFKFKAQVKSRLQVKEVFSTSAPISWERQEGNIVCVTLPESFHIKSDLDLRVLYDNPHSSTLTLEPGIESQNGILQKDLVMLNFYPNIDTSLTASNAEFIFIVDRSGSMGGDNMKQAKATLLIFLKSLPVGCLFNIVSFGSNFTVLFPESQEYNEATLQQAITLQERMTADMGGTEILKPLKHVFENMKTKDNYSRQVFLLTDGMVSNTHAVIDLVKMHAHVARVFSFGIGKGVSTSLVKGIARAGKGKAEFVTGSERLQPKVVSCLRLATQHSTTALSLEWSAPDGISVTTIPDSLPILFAGEHLVACGIIKKECEGSLPSDISATLRGKIGDHIIEEKVTLSENSVCPSNDLALHRIAAKTQIKQLELSDNKTLEGSMSQTKQNIILLSLASNIVSKYTAFFGVDTTTKERVCDKNGIPLWSEFAGIDHKCGYTILKHFRGGQSSHLVQPMKMSTARRSRDRGRQPMMFMDACAEPLAFSSGLLGSSALSLGGVLPPAGAAGKMMKRKCKSDVSATDLPQEDTDTSAPLEAIISLQRYDGSWELTKKLSTVLKIQLQELKAKSPVQKESVWATVLVVAFLENKFKDKEDEWGMIVSKAKSWLQEQTLESPHTLDSLAEEAKQHF